MQIYLTIRSCVTNNAISFSFSSLLRIAKAVDYDLDHTQELIIDRSVQ
jgi:hypothetical protein